MIQAHRDVLRHLDIEHTFITGDTGNGFCTLLGISVSEWIVATDKEFPDGGADINVKYNGRYLTFKAVLQREEGLSYRLRFAEDPAARGGGALIAAITALEAHEELWNKRKEERHKIGRNFSADFGLKKAEQKVIMGGREYPCMVNDVSFSGIKITSFDPGNLERGDEIAVLLDFSHPIERIALKSFVQSVTVKTGEKGPGGQSRLKFAIVSARFTDPPLPFKRRLGAYISRTEGDGHGGSV
jgi:hypothetical protein